MKQDRGGKRSCRSDVIPGRRLGYESEAAFSRAFKRFIGVPPGAARRAASAKGSRNNNLYK
jgi:hypothetical protein